MISKKQSQKKSGGKLLYAFFLDRVSLSIKNGWIDDQGRVFIYYSIKNICEDLNCGTQKASIIQQQADTDDNADSDDDFYDDVIAQSALNWMEKDRRQNPPALVDNDDRK